MQEVYSENEEGVSLQSDSIKEIKESDSSLIDDNEQLLNQQKKEEEKKMPKFIVQMSFVLLNSYFFCLSLAFVFNKFTDWGFYRLEDIVLPSLLIAFLLLIRFVKFLWNFQICVFGLFSFFLLINNILIWSLFILINFHVLFGLLLVQLHITYMINTERKMELTIINFWQSILCGCSVLLIPVNLSRNNGFGAFMEPNFLYILPILFFLYTFMYVMSLRQIANGKFSLNGNQTLIGAVLIFTNMIFPFIPEISKK